MHTASKSRTATIANPDASRSAPSMTMLQAVLIAALMIGSALGTTAVLAIEHVDNPSFRIF